MDIKNRPPAPKRPATTATQQRGYSAAYPNGKPKGPKNSTFSGDDVLRLNWYYMGFGILGFCVGLLFSGVLASIGGA
jgi:hypothetical protein